MRQQIADIIEAKVGYTNGWAIPHEEWSDKALEAADEILALTSHGVVPDREALARALYIINDIPRLEANRAANWGQAQGAWKEELRQEWMSEADRLVRILGGFPAMPERKPNVMEYDGAYKCFTCGNAWGAVTNPTPCTCVPSPSPDAEILRTPTPLYAGPPVDHSQEG